MASPVPGAAPSGEQTEAPGGAPASDAGGPSGEPEVEQERGPLVQHIVIRRDLVEALKWPLGSVIAQGCHAAVAAIWQEREQAAVQQYCGNDNIDSMHKVVLEVKGEPQLRSLSEKLAEGNVGHKLWVEQPENVATCLATSPHFKADVASYFKKLKLCK